MGHSGALTCPHDLYMTNSTLHFCGRSLMIIGITHLLPSRRGEHVDTT